MPGKMVLSHLAFGNVACAEKTCIKSDALSQQALRCNASIINKFSHSCHGGSVHPGHADPAQ